MAQITMKKVSGGDAGKVQLDESYFGIQPNVPVMHQVVTAQLDASDANAALSLRNIPEVQLITTGELNAYDVLCNDTVVFTSSTLPSSAAAESDAS